MVASPARARPATSPLDAAGIVVRTLLACVLMVVWSTPAAFAQQGTDRGRIPTRVIVALDVSGTTRSAALRLAAEILPVLRSASGTHGLEVIVFADQAYNVKDLGQLGQLRDTYPQSVQCGKDPVEPWDSPIGRFDLCRTGFARLFELIGNNVRETQQPHVVWILSDGAADELTQKDQTIGGCEAVPIGELSSRISTQLLDVVLVPLGRDPNCSPQEVERLWVGAFSGLPPVFNFYIERLNSPGHLSEEVSRSVYSEAMHRTNLLDARCWTLAMPEAPSVLGLSIIGNPQSRYVNRDRLSESVEVLWRWRVLQPSSYMSLGVWEDQYVLGGANREQQAMVRQVHFETPGPTEVEAEYRTSSLGGSRQWHWVERGLYRLNCTRRDTMLHANLSIERGLSWWGTSSREYEFRLALERDADDQQKNAAIDKPAVTIDLGSYQSCIPKKNSADGYALRVGDCARSELPEWAKTFWPAVYEIPLFIYFGENTSARVEVRQSGVALRRSKSGAVDVKFAHIGVMWVVVSLATILWAAAAALLGFKRWGHRRWLKRLHVIAACVTLFTAMVLGVTMGFLDIFPVLLFASFLAKVSLGAWLGLAAFAALMSIRVMPQRTRVTCWLVLFVAVVLVLQSLPPSVEGILSLALIHVGALAAYGYSLFRSFGLRPEHDQKWYRRALDLISNVFSSPVATFDPSV